MKFVFAIAAVMLLGVAFAADPVPPQHPQHEMINALIKRGEDLLSHSKEIAESLRKQNKGHLLHAVDHELIYVEALVADLKEQLKHVTGQNIHHIHVLEEELLHRENRLAEEFDIIINRVHPHPHHPHTAAEVIARGEKLVKEASAELKVLGDHSREAKAIEHELFQVEHLLREVKTNPAHSSQLAVEQLARHEHTLDTLIKRAKARGH